MKEQLIKSIEEFRGKWHLLGYKGWLADTLLAIVNLIGITEEDRTQITEDVKNQIPIVQLPKDYFSEEEKTIDGKKYKIISISKEFEARLKDIEDYIKGNREVL